MGDCDFGGFHGSFLVFVFDFLLDSQDAGRNPLRQELIRSACSRKKSHFLTFNLANLAPWVV